MLKVTMSIMTTMTTVLHQDIEMTGRVLKIFHCTSGLYFRASFGFHGVAACSLTGLHDRGVVSPATPFFRSGAVMLPFQRCTVPIFPYWSACILVHACAFDLARH